MPSQWIIEAEPWHWFAIGAPGFFAAWWLYGRGGKGIERKSTGGGLTVAARLLLGLVRWSAFTLLAFLLLEPLIRSIESEQMLLVELLAMPMMMERDQAQSEIPTCG